MNNEIIEDEIIEDEIIEDEIIEDEKILTPISGLPYKHYLPNGNIVTIFKEEDLAIYKLRLFTEEEIQLQQQEISDLINAQQMLDDAKQQEILFLRQAYKETTNGMCLLAGVNVVDKVESAFELAEMKNNITDFNKRLSFAELALQLQTIIIELRRKDGDDAWERI